MAKKRPKKRVKDLAFTKWSRKVDLFLFFLGLVFPVIGILQWISFEKGMLIFGLHSLIALTSFVAKKSKTRLSSFIAYFLFFIGISALLDESGLLYEGYTSYSTFEQYMTISLGAAVIAALFNFKAYAITGSLAAYWTTLFLFSMQSSKSLSPGVLLSNVGTEYARLGMGGVHAQGAIVVALLFGLIAFMLHYSQRPRGSRGRGFFSGGGGYYAGGGFSSGGSGGSGGGPSSWGGDNHDYDHSSGSSGFNGGESDNNHYGWSQSQIDADNDAKYYGTPSWYQDKQIEENDYGKPWYARDEDDGFGRPSWARDDDDDD